MATASILLLLLILITINPSHGSETNALNRLISDLHAQRPRQAGRHHCSIPGITCETAYGGGLRVTHLIIGSRGLDGTLSPAIGRLSGLRELSLPDNRLSGDLPQEIARCSALQILDLRGNRLSGDIPREITSLASLRVLDLSSNRFTGDLDFLANLHNLEKLSIANNLFSGRVPGDLSSHPSLISINLSGNPDLQGDHLLRRSLLPNRYILAENSTSNSTRRNSSSNAATAPAPSPAASTSHHHHKSKRHRVRNWVIGFVAGSLAGIVTGLILSVLFRMLLNCIRGRYKDPTGPTIYSSLIKSPEDLAFLTKEDGLASLEVIGRGGCGEVYRAPHPSDPNKMIAIKKIRKRRDDGGEPTAEESELLDKWMRQIRSEIITVGRIRHRNLLPLLAHVSRPDCHFLVYEFMKNGSLHDILTKGQALDWLARHKIAMGIASGLEYLHHDHRPHIIHRDLKPGNILLDDDMEARIADFGLAKEMPENNTHMTTSNVAGTVGYIAPEYYQMLKFTTKCDIYSLGVILAVLVVGKLPSDDFFQETDEVSLVKWIRKVMSSVNPTMAIDPQLAGQGYEDQMLLVLKIAYFCTLEDPKERPNSKEVRDMLAQIKY